MDDCDIADDADDTDDTDDSGALDDDKYGAKYAASSPHAINRKMEIMIMCFIFHPLKFLI